MSATMNEHIEDALRHALRAEADSVHPTLPDACLVKHRLVTNRSARLRRWRLGGVAAAGVVCAWAVAASALPILTAPPTSMRATPLAPGAVASPSASAPGPRIVAGPYPVAPHRCSDAVAGAMAITQAHPNDFAAPIVDPSSCIAIVRPLTDTGHRLALSAATTPPTVPGQPEKTLPAMQNGWFRVVESPDAPSLSSDQQTIGAAMEWLSPAVLRAGVSELDGSLVLVTKAWSDDLSARLAQRFDPRRFAISVQPDLEVASPASAAAAPQSATPTRR